MATPTDGRWRLFRACVFATVATQLAAMGHLLGGGDLPDLSVLLAVTVLLGGSLSGFATRRRSWPQIFAALVASQLVFHAAFSLTAHHHAPSGTGTTPGTTAMICFHLLAATAASWVMAGGERDLFRLFAALHRALVRVARMPAIGLPPYWTAVTFGRTGRSSAGNGEWPAASLRGPPVAT